MQHLQKINIRKVNMKKIISVIIITVTVLCLFCSCGESAEKNRLSIVCSTFPQYDFAKNIAGERIDIRMLDSASDIHSFEPTAADLMTISEADLFIYIGGESDKWVAKAIESCGNPDLKAVSLMDCITAVDEETVEGMQSEEEEESPEADEHIWLSLRNAKLMVDYICENICAIDPENASIYKSNSDSYIQQLDVLDKKYAEVVSTAKRKTVLFADRFPFRYLVEDYGLEYYAAFSGCSAETSASFQTVTFLIEKAKELKLPVILVTESSDKSIAETVCKETGSKIAVMDSCQSVHAKQVKDGADYFEIMAENLNVLKEALN